MISNLLVFLLIIGLVVLFGWLSSHRSRPEWALAEKMYVEDSIVLHPCTFRPESSARNTPTPFVSIYLLVVIGLMKCILAWNRPCVKLP